ncbi:MAG: alkaline phosphatase family protein [Pyrinomonadaceae bacterium]|nr:alkaline phosphatase family protein [Sphingobacteriaceae bacterium]
MDILTSSDKQTKPERTILFIIDGLPAGIEQRIEMPNLLALKYEGVSYEEVYLPLAGHPAYSETYPWTCTIPNPVLMSGTIFIGQEGLSENLIQHSFTEKPTAFYTNSWTYEAISHGFTHYVDFSENKRENLFKDELPIEAAKQAIVIQNPEFIRVHCQGPGSAGHRSHRESDQPYTGNIWAADSPFIQQNQYVDKLLGDFVDWLKTESLWDETVLFVMGDHGQCDTGGHGTYEPGGYTTQLVIAGNHIRKGINYKYAEMIDIAPTIAWLHHVPAPKFSAGRVLQEITGEEVNSDPITPSMKLLDESLIEYNRLNQPVEGFLTIEEIGLWHTTPAKADYLSFVQQQVSLINHSHII